MEASATFPRNTKGPLAVAPRPRSPAADAHTRVRAVAEGVRSGLSESASFAGAAGLSRSSGTQGIHKERLYAPGKSSVDDRVRTEHHRGETVDYDDFLMLDEPSPAGSTTLTVPEPRDLRLPLSGWMLRLARNPEGRPALEVHSGAGLMDVSVVSTLCFSPLRGGWNGGRPGARWSLAWGQLPPGADVVEVCFRRWRRNWSVQALTVADAFWVAEVGDRFRSVTCTAGAALATARVVGEPRARAA